ncbi:MAG: hypothetical protein LCH53_04300 [Bacteroidetes bacterium]|nr:hypothetical protein [Bacteroidota bacterium]
MKTLIQRRRPSRLYVVGFFEDGYHYKSEAHTRLRGVAKAIDWEFDSDVNASEARRCLVPGFGGVVRGDRREAVVIVTTFDAALSQGLVLAHAGGGWTYAPAS